MIDTSTSSALAICDKCGRRQLHTTREAARSWLAGHEAHAHAGTYTDRNAAKVAATRRAQQLGECVTSTVL